ncbi:hepatitis A virus cellular receptor 2 isoform X3 [Ailuropoda melanoleuca]|uniref:hepatitis A virus cellular receptor 2 isoform X3 n=1 Tax=Ailuropoda melanoleuca TaxID=9646 RepID=UPI0014945116|nr:hepatitis A virus cellular receptor 2 isoform X3 [Ailuropoda melanoleuca]
MLCSYLVFPGNQRDPHTIHFTQTITSLEMLQASLYLLGVFLTERHVASSECHFLFVESMVSPLPFDCVLLGLLLLTGSLEGVYVAEVGQNADLPCVYSPTTSEALVPVCWGRGSCPVFECHSMVLSTDGRSLKYQTSNRYQLKRNIHKGDVSLTIENVTLADGGTYCCRIQFPGIMNDKKLNLELVIKPAKVTSAPTPRRDSTAAFPWILTTKGHGAETQTLEALHDKQQTQIPTLANELQDAGATTRIGVYIGAGVSAGLALLLIIGALILTSSSVWPSPLPRG